MGKMGQLLLVLYSALLSTALGVLMLTGASTHDDKSFDRIRVHRIDVVEPDGTLRMVISDKAQLPPVIIKGKEHPEMGEPRPQAGMIFYNDEGSENGGLIFGGHQNEKGQVVDSGGSLSFDRYGANQIVQLAGVDDETDHFAGLAVGDQNRRVWVGRTDDGNASIALMDASGKRRIVMEVTKDGTASILFLDPLGRVTRRLLPN
jgi:hypothetical protein